MSVSVIRCGNSCKREIGSLGKYLRCIPAQRMRKSDRWLGLLCVSLLRESGASRIDKAFGQYNPDKRCPRKGVSASIAQAE
jgi:hypothetical protein